MKASFLLPHKFKVIGLISAPLGFIVWSLCQLNIFEISGSQFLRVLFLVLSALMCILGFFALVFSKEKIEDEFINQKRLETLFLSAAVQAFLVLIGFFTIGYGPWPQTKEGQMFYFIACIFSFYLFYIIRFNFATRVKEEKL